MSRENYLRLIFHRTRINIKLSTGLLTSILFILSSSVLCQDQINLNRHNYSTITTESEVNSAAYLVKYFGKREGLNQLGIKVLKKLDESHFIVSKPSVKDITIFESVTNANNLWKLTNDLHKSNKGVIPSSAKLSVTISDEIAFTRDMRQAGIEFSVLKKYKDALQINLLQDENLDNIISIPSILSINLTSDEVIEEAPLRDFNYNVNRINTLRHEAAHLNGQGQVVSIMEKSYDIDDIDFKGRHIESSLRPSEVSNHSTEMATIVAGGGNSSFQGRGIAWGAKLTSSDFTNTLPDADSAYRNLSATVQNHSYGTLPENFYGAEARAYDLSANSNPELLHIFSAGNHGFFTHESGSYAGIEGMANLTGNFKMAKNILTVGGLDTVNTLIEDLSKGPAYDGRVKPELVAYSLTGSSSSAAVVSGIVLLLQQAYKETYQSVPSSALLKAILVNSADDVGPPGVDFISGYGNVNAFKAWKTLAEDQFFQGEVKESETVSFTISVPENAVNLKVSLVWNDPAADANTTVALVNDVDLQLVGVSSQSVYLPWVLNTWPHLDSLKLPAQRRQDRLNNIEQISIAEPGDESYRIDVSGFNLESGTQSFFIAYQWDTLNTFKWTSPTGSDNLPQDGEIQSFFRWESTFKNSTGQLQYSINGGTNWITIEDHVDLGKKYYSWKPPKYTGIAKARMVISDNIYETDNFVISRPLRVDVGFDCQDSLLLTWPKLDNITKYIISSPGKKYLETVTETTDTVIVMNKSEFSQTKFTVTPIIDDKQGLRNLTFDYTSRGSGCYIMNFFTNLNSNVGIDLGLSLGTTYKVARVSYQKLENGRYKTIYSKENLETNDIFFTDTTAQDGLNIYRANIEFSSGSNIYSEVDTIRFLKTTVAVLFPNPAKRHKSLNILLKDFDGNDAFFHLFNSRGNLILIKKLRKERDQVLLAPYADGLYLYEIVSANDRQTGRIIIR